MKLDHNREALEVASLAGEILLESGAEIFRVEDTIGETKASSDSADASKAPHLSGITFPAACW